MGAPRWEHFEHEADLGVRGVGPSMESAFEQAATAMSAAVVDPSSIDAHIPVTIECRAPAKDLLLVDFLNALVFEMARRRMIFGRFEVKLNGNRLDAVAWGEPLEPSRHRPVVEPKGATFTELRVRRSGDEWIAQCVIDV